MEVLKRWWGPHWHVTFGTKTDQQATTVILNLSLFVKYKQTSRRGRRSNECIKGRLPEHDDEQENVSLAYTIQQHQPNSLLTRTSSRRRFVSSPTFIYAGRDHHSTTLSIVSLDGSHISMTLSRTNNFQTLFLLSHQLLWISSLQLSVSLLHSFMCLLNGFRQLFFPWHSTLCPCSVFPIPTLKSISFVPSVLLSAQSESRTH